MRIVITAVGPDNRRLADPIVHYVTGQGANIAEIQMYDHDEEHLVAMMLRGLGLWFSVTVLASGIIHDPVVLAGPGQAQGDETRMPIEQEKQLW